jgi:hypothetical protein
VINLAVGRTDGVFPISQARETFHKYGIVILRDYLSADSKTAVRKILISRLETARAAGNVLHFGDYPDADFLLGDVLSVRELDPYDNIFFTPEAVRMAKALLGTEDLLYWGDSSIQFGVGARGFHKDNVDRLDGTQDDWSRDYELLRCGVYFQDHMRHSGGLKVRLSSHNFPTHRRGKIIDVLTENGDLVIWNMRLTHSGNYKKLRFPNWISLHPKLEGLAPYFAFAPEQTRRVAAFCSFGKSGTHADRYIERMNAREADYKPYFQHARNRTDAAAMLSRRGVSFRLPNDFYGELD